MSTKGAHRPTFLRVLRVASEIRNRQSITASELAVMMNTSDKTIYRDLDFLKDIGAPIYFNPKLNTWIWNPLLPTPWYFGGTIKNPKLSLL